MTDGKDHNLLLAVKAKNLLLRVKGHNLLLTVTAHNLEYHHGTVAAYVLVPAD